MAALIKRHGVKLAIEKRWILTRMCFLIIILRHKTTLHVRISVFQFYFKVGICTIKLLLFNKCFTLVK